jgi:mRNA interferase HigB
VRIIARKTLKDFWKKNPTAQQPLKSWFAEVEEADWTRMADIKEQYAHVSIIDNERVVFNIGGNKFRLVVKLWFSGRCVWIKFIGTHAEYNSVNVRTL